MGVFVISGLVVFNDYVIFYNDIVNGWIGLYVIYFLLV